MPEITKDAIALEFAGFWRRLGAYVIDTFILAGVFSFLEPVYSSGFQVIWNFSFVDDAGLWVKHLMNLESPAAIILSGLYFVAFWVTRGQTLGMMVAGVKVIRLDGTGVDTGRAIVRYFGYIISIIPLFLGFIWIAIDAHKQGWHDKMAETYVVKVPPIAEAAPAAPPHAAA
jgi:uncharacterized RDD family membrane protein YckC